MGPSSRSRAHRFASSATAVASVFITSMWVAVGAVAPEFIWQGLRTAAARLYARRGGPSGDAGERGDGADNRRATLHAAVGDVFKTGGRRSVSEQCGLNCRDHHSMHANWTGDQ